MGYVKFAVFCSLCYNAPGNQPICAECHETGEGPSEFAGECEATLKELRAMHFLRAAGQLPACYPCSGVAQFGDMMCNGCSRKEAAADPETPAARPAILERPVSEERRR